MTQPTVHPFDANRVAPWAYVASAVIVALALAVQLRTPLNSDIGFLLSTARRVASGEALYVDILEINPPLIVWLKIPIVLLADAIGARESVVFPIVVTLLALGSAAASAALVRRTSLARSRRVIPAGVLVLLAMLLLFPGGMFGQREHLTIILTLPVVLLVGIRVEGAAVGRAAAAAIGGAAAIGLAIKPHFAVMYLLLFAYRLAATRGKGEARLTIEDWVIGLSAVAYVAAVVILTPQYFDYVGRVGEIYFGFARRSVATILFKRLPAIWVYVALAIWWTRRRGQPRQEPLTALAVATVGSVLAVVLQHKGWSYHFYPSTVLAVLLAAGSLADAPGVEHAPERRGARRLAALLVAVYALVLGSRVVNDGWKRLTGGVPERQEAIRPLVEAVARQDDAASILVLSSEIVDAYPVVNETGLRDRASFPYMWIFTYEYTDVRDDSMPPVPRAPAEMRPMERFAFERVVHDLVSEPPDVILAETPARNRERVGQGLDYLALLSQDTAVARVLQQYHAVDEVAGVRVLRRRPPD